MQRDRIITKGFFGGVPREIREAIRDGGGSDIVEIIDDQSSRPWNQEWTICVLADIHCDDGALRIGYYADGADTVVDEANGFENCDDWANAWDSDGVVPTYLYGSAREDEDEAEAIE